MSTLLDTLQAVKEKDLPEAKLEEYSDTLTSLYADMMIEIATLKKSRAIYFYTKEQEHPEMPDVKIKRVWDATDEGQELIKLEHYVKATSKVLSSIKSRLFHYL